MLGAPPDTGHMMKASTLNPLGLSLLGLRIQGPDDECFDTDFSLFHQDIQWPRAAGRRPDNFCLS